MNLRAIACGMAFALTVNAVPAPAGAAVSRIAVSPAPTAEALIGALALTRRPYHVLLRFRIARAILGVPSDVAGSAWTAYQRFLNATDQALDALRTTPACVRGAAAAIAYDILRARRLSVYRKGNPFLILLNFDTEFFHAGDAQRMMWALGFVRLERLRATPPDLQGLANDVQRARKLVTEERVRELLYDPAHSRILRLVRWQLRGAAAPRADDAALLPFRHIGVVPGTPLDPQRHTYSFSHKQSGLRFQISGNFLKPAANRVARVVYAMSAPPRGDPHTPDFHDDEEKPVHFLFDRFPFYEQTLNVHTVHIDRAVLNPDKPLMLKAVILKALLNRKLVDFSLRAKNRTWAQQWEWFIVYETLTLTTWVKVMIGHIGFDRWEVLMYEFGDDGMVFLNTLRDALYLADLVGKPRNPLSDQRWFTGQNGRLERAVERYLRDHFQRTVTRTHATLYPPEGMLLPFHRGLGGVSEREIKRRA